MNRTIIIEPKNPLDVKPAELQGLAKEISSLFPDFEIKVEEGRGYGGYAVTFWECVLIWVAVRVSEALLDQLVGLAVEWARRRFAKSGKEKRPKCIKIFGPDGYIVKTVSLQNATDEPEIRTESNGKMGEQFRLPVKRKPVLRTLWHRLLKSKRSRN